MKRKLLRQILNEWRDNIWMVIELTIVTIVAVILMAGAWTVVKGRFIPKGYDASDVYTMSLKIIGNNSPEYIARNDTGEYQTSDYFYDRDALMARLRENPHVVAAATHSNGVPFNYNFQGVRANIVGQSDSVDYYANARYVEPDMVDVMRYESATGLTSEHLKEALNRGEILLSTNSDYEHMGRDPFVFKGKTVYLGSNVSQELRVADIIKTVRRNDYEPSYGGTMIYPLESGQWANNVAIRVKPGQGQQFVDYFSSHPELRRQRNVYFSDLTPLSNLRESAQRGIETEINLRALLLVFMLVTIFLGLLGTFWFRVQQRVSEVAIRKVCGATKWQIFRRILAEGLILQLVSTIIAGALIWIFVSKLNGYVGTNESPWIVLILITAALVAVGIVLSLAWPAYKVMKIEPAIAIKDE